jgi:hypothetical protein
MIKGDALF